MKQQEYWNRAAQKKEFTTPFHGEEFTKYADKQGIILDVGCGYGRTLDELHQVGFQNLIGIDFSQSMIERGQEQYPYLDLRVKRGEAIDLPGSSVDAVILFAVLTCIRSDEEQKYLIKEIKRVLRYLRSI